MNPFSHKLLVLLLLMSFLGKGYSQDSILFSNGSTVTIDGYLSPVGIIFDDGGDLGCYSNSFNGVVRILANPGDTIQITGSYRMEYSYELLFFYQADGTLLPDLLETCTGTGSVSVMSTTGYMTIYFSSDVSTVDSGFALHYSVRPTHCSNFINNLAATEVTSSSLHLSWSAINPTGTFLIHYGSVDTVLNQTYCDITGLVPGQDYRFSVVALSDAALLDCKDSIDVHTPCFKAVINGLQPLCGNNSITLTADSADAYLWSTGATTRSIVVTETGEYSLTVYTLGGCEDSTHVTVTPIRLDLEYNIPELICPGQSTNIRVGFGLDASVRVIRNESTLSEVSRIFLPDGVYCDPNGCSYRSELQFSGFDPSARINDVNDIRYVMLNIEHSYVGDIYINITCPNSQKADILKYSGVGSSSCTGSILPANRGWQAGYNVSTSTFWGLAYDVEDNMYVCDSTAPNNCPGTGWRYCWSNCTDAGYSYAPADGLIYRAPNLVTSSVGYTLDSSNVAAGTNFYHPDESLASLIGCPMNGVWYIEVIDGWSGDNGYIFGWELALNPNRLVRNDYVPTVAYVDMIGPWATRTSDTTFIITAPDTLTIDSTVHYLLYITDSMGCVFDTTFTVVFAAQSTRTFYDTILENNLPRLYQSHSFDTDTSHFTIIFSGPNGCDSIIDYNLHVIRNTRSTLDSTVCINELPLLWFHRTFTASDVQNDTILNHLGADSILTLVLHTNPISADTISATICSNQSYIFDDSYYTSPGTYTNSYRNTLDCDSLRTLCLTVNNTSYSDTFAVACDSFDWHSQHFIFSDTVTISPVALNAVGCDSSVTLYLTLGHSTHTNVYDTVFENDLPHNYHDISLNDDTENLLVTLSGSDNCDSIIHYNLHVIRNTYAQFDTTFCVNFLPIQWFHRLFTSPGTQYDTISNHLGADSLLTLTLHISPVYDDTVSRVICSNQTTQFEGATYFFSGDYTHNFYTDFGCDSLRTLHLLVNAVTSGDTHAVVCDSFFWYNQTFTVDTTLLVPGYTLNANGCDSSVTLHLSLLHSTSSIVFDTVSQSQLPYTYHGVTFYADSSQAIIHIPNSVGCDSLITYNLTVDWNSHQYFDTAICSDQLPITWHGHLFTGPGTRTDTYISSHGADSVVTLTLLVAPAYNYHIDDTVCQGSVYLFGDRQLTLSGEYSDTLLTTLGCDSIVQLSLAVIELVPLDLQDEYTCLPPEHYLITASVADGWHYQWSSRPDDPSLSRQEESNPISVNPAQTTTYTLQFSYGVSGWCPLLDSIQVIPIVPLHVNWEVKPEALSEDNLTLSAVNLSSGYSSQSWLLNGSLTDNSSPQFIYELSPTTDSVILTLIINNELCSDTASKTIYKLHSFIVFPNVFTPSKDENNIFKSYGVDFASYEIWIYDRFGTLVYHSTDPNVGWDGTHNGTPCKQGAYVYNCRYSVLLSPNAYQRTTGTVTLIR